MMYILKKKAMHEFEFLKVVDRQSICRKGKDSQQNIGVKIEVDL